MPHEQDEEEHEKDSRHGTRVAGNALANASGARRAEI
jgi:hypothetical protein